LLKFREPIIHYFLNLLIDLLAWPLVVALLIARILGLIKFDHRLYEMPAVILRMAWAMSLVPLFWFALLLAANYLLLKPGS